MSDELCWMSALELSQRIRARQVSPREVVAAVLAQIDRVNPAILAVCTRMDQQARQQAEQAEAAVMRGDPLGPLHGVPITVKDLHYTAGVRTTLGSKLYEHFVPSFDHPIVQRLKRAGAILIGKTNTSEFGLIPLAMNSIFGESINPWSPEHNTGGSSGGAAAAVACGMGPLATGSDGGGSIRIPASFCGIFGLKPHLGRIPHRYEPPGWENLSHHGPLARTVRDAALMLQATAGPMTADRWSLPATDTDWLAACEQPVRGLKLAWSPDLGGLPIEREVRDRCAAAARRFQDLGCVVEEVSLDLPDLSPAQQAIVLCEAATAMSDRRDEWQRVIYPAMSRLLTNADKLTYQDLVRAHWAREDYWARIAPLFEQFDALLTPTSPITATLKGTLGPKVIDGKSVRALSWLGFVVPFNMTWQPAASLPVGFDHNGLPVGLQVVGRRFDEATVLQLSAAYEAAHPWNRRPPVV
jgi:aspartyl-tRNA(Asn)/glutamyl-tRNA(Gln) amidotransferase subunit A